MSRSVFSVAQLTRELRTTLETGFDRIWVEGEISNLARPPSGHLYFSLVENKAVIRCALFRNRRHGRQAVPEEGMKVLVCGQVSLYEPRGDLQLIVSHVEEAGEGALRREFERLKSALAAEGLFDTDTKQPLPPFPTAIGIVTSPDGAALHDIRVTLARRFPLARVVVYPSLVQGLEAPKRLVEMVNLANERNEVDVLIVGRGGGSLEDLQAFNEESLARAIHASRIPVVSAVGHEIDFSIADFVADFRAPTPTAAAEAVSPEQAVIESDIARSQRALERTMRHLLDRRRQLLDYTRSRIVHPLDRIRWGNQQRQALTLRLERRLEQVLERNRQALIRHRTNLRIHSPLTHVRQRRQQLENLNLSLHFSMRECLVSARHRAESSGEKLALMSPAHTLGRGYAILQDRSNRVVSRATAVREGEPVTARLAEGSLECDVVRVHPK